MALFQISVLKTYLTQQDSNVVARAYKKYTKYFHNLTIKKILKTQKRCNTKPSFWMKCLVVFMIIILIELNLNQK